MSNDSRIHVKMTQNGITLFTIERDALIQFLFIVHHLNLYLYPTQWDAKSSMMF